MRGGISAKRLCHVLDRDAYVHEHVWEGMYLYTYTLTLCLAVLSQKLIAKKKEEVMNKKKSILDEDSDEFEEDEEEIIRAIARQEQVFQKHQVRTYAVRSSGIR